MGYFFFFKNHMKQFDDKKSEINQYETNFCSLQIIIESVTMFFGKMLSMIVLI